MRDRELLEHIFQSLRTGAVPDRGGETFAVGLEGERQEIERLLDYARKHGASKFLRGSYGSGKTFVANLSQQWALEKNYVVAKVVVSVNDTQFHKFDQVYHKIATSMRSRTVRQGMMASLLDRWLTQVEDKLIDLGADPDAPDFDAQVLARVPEELGRLSEHVEGTELVPVLASYFDAKQKKDHPRASAMLSWLSGNATVGAAFKRKTGIKGHITPATAMLYLKSLVRLMTQVGYTGLLVVVDELETVTRMRNPAREETLNAIRQIVDDDIPGLFWLFTGTPEFFDGPKGVPSLAPLHQRIRFTAPRDGIRNLMQPQLELRPFDHDRLMEAGRKIRALREALDEAPYAPKFPDQALERLAQRIIADLGGDMGVTPRHFLRALVTELDVCQQHGEAFKPSERGVEATWLTDFERELLGRLSPEAEALQGELLDHARVPR